MESDASPPKIYKCHVCDVKFGNDQSAYDKHVDNDEDHLSSLVKRFPDLNSMTCTDCNCEISGYKNYNQHLKSIKHKNCMAMNEKASPEVYYANGDQASTPGIEEGTSGGLNQQYFCKPCGKPISGHKNVAEHNRSAKHIKKLELKMNERMTAGQQEAKAKDLIQALQDLQVSSPSDKSSINKIIDNVQLLQVKSPQPVSNGDNDAIPCLTCNTTVNGQENWRQHIAGKNHKKKEQLLLTATSLKSTTPQAPITPKPTSCITAPSSSSAMSLLKEAIFSPSNSTVPTPAHATSTPRDLIAQTTRAPLTAKSFLNSSAASTSVSLPASSPATPSGLSFYRDCLVCKTSVCGDGNWQAHIKGQKHLKKAAMSQPMTPSAPLYSDQATMENPTAGPTSEPFYCGICRVGMTGKENVEDHLAGKKHKAHQAMLEKSLEEPSESAREELAAITEKDSMGRAVYPKSCPTCNGDMRSMTTEDAWINHLKGSKHKTYQKIWEVSRSAQIEGNMITSPFAAGIEQEREKDDDMTAPEMGRYRQGPGLMLIINQEFKDNPKWRRDGSDEDVVRLIECFSTFDFEIVVKHDLKHQGIYNALYEVRNKLNSSQERYSCLVVAMMSHGKERHIMALETNRWFPVDELPDIFSKTACPGLSNRPSIFFVNACRGNVYNLPVHFKVATTVQTDGPALTKTFQGQGNEPVEPEKCDYLISYSCTGDNPAYRLVNHVANYIDRAC